MSRTSMNFGGTEYGKTYFSTMTGNEPGYATEPGEIMLHSITLPKEAVALIRQGHAVRICEDGTCEPIEGERAGLIVFGPLQRRPPDFALEPLSIIK